MAGMMLSQTQIFRASPVAAFKAYRPAVVRRSGLVVRAQDPAAAPDSAVTPEEILSCKQY